MTDEKNPTTSTAKHGSVLVLGGGIAGIQSALDLADAGFKVYLVEKQPSIGGTMPQLDKTFPTNDCCADCFIVSTKAVSPVYKRSLSLLFSSIANFASFTASCCSRKAASFSRRS